MECNDGLVAARASAIADCDLKTSVSGYHTRITGRLQWTTDCRAPKCRRNGPASDQSPFDLRHFLGSSDYSIGNNPQSLGMIGSHSRVLVWRTAPHYRRDI
jgi:hypothetical protein